MATTRAELLILGAGIAGCALAYHLARGGLGPLLVYDPRTPGAGATGRAAGIVTEQHWNRWDVEVTRASQAQYAELSARWDPTAYAVNGFARWAHGPESLRSLDAALARLRAWGVRVEPIDAAGLRARVPWGRFDDEPRGIWCPTDAVVTPSTMGEIYAEGARRAGAELLLGTPMDRFGRADGSWELATGGRTVRASTAVVAAGAWSKSILRSIGRPLPLAPYRTQAAVLRPGAGPAIFPSVHDIDDDVYARPESNGRVLAGDGTRLVEVDPDSSPSGADESFVEHLAATFGRRFPGWADAELVRAWSGVCTSTPDRRPLVGPVPGADRLFALVGFNGFGVMRAGGTAERLADLLLRGGNAEEEALRPVWPGRFPSGQRPFAPRPGFTLDDGDDPRF
jgi:sarcosine oxidase, subunit beta